jgi:predicted esterase
MRPLFTLALPAFLAILTPAAGPASEPPVSAFPSASTNAPAAKAPTAADLAKKRLEMLKNQPLDARTIFDGATFPKVDFLNKELVEAAIGAYSLHLRFFDAQWKEVASPEGPGRYGALVELSAPDGVAFRRTVTFFKTPQHYVPALDPYGITARVPAVFGLPDDVQAREQWNISDWIDRDLEDSYQQGDSMAILAAALHDLAADPARWQGFRVWRIEDAWWDELYKRLGENQDYPHLTYLPDGYGKDSRTWPLILFLHGSGERGTDLNKVKKYGPATYAAADHSLPFIIVTPQCPNDEWWEPARLERLLDEVAASYRVDPKRVYVTGLSMGGYGTLDLAATYPDKFAAIAPLSGGEDPGLADRLKAIPAWIFHGAVDATVPPRYSIDLFHALQKLGAPVKLTIYPGVGHGGWDKTYSDPDLYTWFLAQSK